MSTISDIFLEEKFKIIVSDLVCTVGQAMDILKIKRSSIHSLIQNYTIPAIKIGEVYLLHKDSVLKYALSPQRSYGKREESRNYLQNNTTT